MCITRETLKTLIIESLEELGGRGTIAEVCKIIWENYEMELRDSGDIFYTWQYDLRWAGQKLRDEGKIGLVTKRGPWILHKDV